MHYVTGCKRAPSHHCMSCRRVNFSQLLSRCMLFVSCMLFCFRLQGARRHGPGMAVVRGWEVVYWRLTAGGGG